MKTTNGNYNDGKPSKDDRFDENSAKTQLNLDLKYLTRAIDAMCKIWDKYTDIDPKYRFGVYSSRDYYQAPENGTDDRHPND